MFSDRAGVSFAELSHLNLGRSLSSAHLHQYDVIVMGTGFTECLLSGLLCTIGMKVGRMSIG